MLNKLLKIDNNAQVILLVLFVIYIIFNIPTPVSIASFIDSTLGYVVIIALFALMAVHLNPVVTLIGVFAIYLLFKRSSIIDGQAAIVKYLPTEHYKMQHLNAYNQFAPTLEQEMVNKMAPLVGPSASPNAVFRPNQDNHHDAAPVNYEGVI